MLNLRCTRAQCPIFQQLPSSCRTIIIQTLRGGEIQRLLYSLLCRAAWACSQQRAPSTAHDRWRAVRTAATGTNACTARRAPPARWPCTAVHAMRCSCGLLARCSVACALPETAQGCGSVRSTLLERCCWPAVHVVRWGFVGGSFRRTARAVNFYYFRSSVHLLAPCTPAPPAPGAAVGPVQLDFTVRSIKPISEGHSFHYAGGPYNICTAGPRTNRRKSRHLRRLR